MLGNWDAYQIIVFRGLWPATCVPSESLMLYIYMYMGPWRCRHATATARSEAPEVLPTEALRNQQQKMKTPLGGGGSP